MKMVISEKSPILAGVMGWPVSQSLSPVLHRYWLKQLGLNGDYVPLAVRPQNLEQAIRGLYALGFSGVNVTIPHKETAARIVDRLHPLARRIGAANLIVVDEKGRLEGRNTDAYGCLAWLDHCAPAWRTGTTSALVLGAGGAARAVAIALLDAGISRLYIVNRTKERADVLAQSLDDKRVLAAGWQERSAILKETTLLINSTSLGMAGQAPLDIALSLMQPGSVVYDIVYKPLQTDLLQEAQRRGLVAVDGLGMLIYQAVPSFEAFYGATPVVDDDLHSYLSGILTGEHDKA